MAKCMTCPHWQTCQEECYGDNPCDFATAFDRLSRKAHVWEDVVWRQKNELQDARRNIAALDIREFGDYVLTPMGNSSGGKVSWWISKKGFMAARYCFTTSDEKEVEYQIKNGLNGYIKLLDDTLQRVEVPGRVDRLLKDLLWALPDAPRSYDPNDDPGFWTDGKEILCPSDTECAILAAFLVDVVSEMAPISIHTGYHAPNEAAKSGKADEKTGFYYISLD